MTKSASMAGTRASNLLQRWDSTSIGELGQPGVGYFLIWLVCQAAGIGVLIGGTVSQPEFWRVHLIAITLIVVVTFALYYAMLGIQRVFRRVDQWLEAK